MKLFLFQAPVSSVRPRVRILSQLGQKLISSPWIPWPGWRLHTVPWIPKQGCEKMPALSWNHSCVEMFYQLEPMKPVLGEGQGPLPQNWAEHAQKQLYRSAKRAQGDFSGADSTSFSAIGEASRWVEGHSEGLGKEPKKKSLLPQWFLRYQMHQGLLGILDEIHGFQALS